MRLLPALIPLLLATAAASASPLGDAARQLDGEWTGEGFRLRIDSARAQASTNPDKPFQWQRFIVREAAGEKVVFAIGPDLYEATVLPEVLTLTSTSFRGERVLLRLDALQLRR